MKIPQYSDEKLRAMTVSQRHNLYKNALSLDTEDAHALIARLRSLGLPYSDSKALALDDPISLKMYEIIHSPNGIEAMRDAIANGFPPMVGVDPLLATALGVDYGAHNMATQTAGYFVSQKMQSLGYKKLTQRSLPVGCVARSATAFGR